MLDFHTHIFSPYAQAHRGELAKQDAGFCRIYGNGKARMIKAEELIEGMDRDGVGEAVACGFPWVSAEACRRENDYILESAQRYAGRIIPFITLPQRVEEAIAELERCRKGRAAGIGEWGPGTYGGDLWSIEVIAPIAEAIRSAKVPLLVHVNETVGHSYPGKGGVGPRGIEMLIRALQGVTVILAHWGGGFFFYELMPEVASLCQSVYYDTAASPFLYDKRIYRIAIGIVGEGRIVFGSDYPLIPPARYRKELEAAGLTESQQEAILGLNARCLLSRLE